MSMKAFTACEVQQRTGVSYRQLDHLARTGALRPSVATASGRGSRRIYSNRDVIALRLGLLLQQAGLGWRAVERVAKYIQQSERFSDAHDLGGQILVVAQDVIRVVAPNELAAICEAESPLLVVVPLDQLIDVNTPDLENNETARA